jgi:hypothetical protein
MESLEKKEMRLEFLRELNDRGIYSVKPQIERIVDEITLIKIQIELERRKKSRENKINKIVKNEGNL